MWRLAICRLEGNARYRLDSLTFALVVARVVCTLAEPSEESAESQHGQRRSSHEPPSFRHLQHLAIGISHSAKVQTDENFFSSLVVAVPSRMLSSNAGYLLNVQMWADFDDPNAGGWTSTVERAFTKHDVRNDRLLVQIGQNIKPCTIRSTVTIFDRFPGLIAEERLLAVRKQDFRCCAQNKFRKYKFLVKTALGDLQSWRDVEVDEIQVQDVSAGASGRKTFKIRAGESNVALSLYDDDPTLMQRLAVVHQALVGMVPRKLAEGEFWMITEWVPGGVVKLEEEEDAQEAIKAAGALLARIHSVDTKWFDEFRSKIVDEHPWLTHVPEGSHIWPYYARGINFTPYKAAQNRSKDGLLHASAENGTEELLQAWADCNVWCPQHPVGQRIVTVLANFHTGNILRAQESANADGSNNQMELKVINFDFACVSHAILDLGVALARLQQSLASSSHALSSGLDIPGVKRSFLMAYLEELGEPVDDATVDALHVDSELAVLGSWAPGMLSSICQSRARKFRAQLTETCRRRSHGALGNHTSFFA